MAKKVDHKAMAKLTQENSNLKKQIEAIELKLQQNKEENSTLQRRLKEIEEKLENSANRQEILRSDESNSELSTSGQLERNHDVDDVSRSLGGMAISNANNPLTGPVINRWRRKNLHEFLEKNANETKHSEMYDDFFDIEKGLSMRLELQCGFGNIHVSACWKKESNQEIFNHVVIIEVLNDETTFKFQQIEYDKDEYCDRIIHPNANLTVLRKHLHLKTSENNFLDLCKSKSITFRCKVYLK